MLIDLMAKLNDRVLARAGLYLTNCDRNFRDVVRHEVMTERVTTVLDVGASHGQYGEALRAAGFRGRVVSFEPEASSFARLAPLAKADGMWQALNIGLGSESTRAELHVAGNLVSSSLLPMTELHETAAAGSAVTSTQAIDVRRLDDVISEIRLDDRAIVHMKIDVQGFEGEVLSGAPILLADKRLHSIELELSTAQLYESQSDWHQTVGELRSHGFELVNMSGGFFDKRTRHMLQFDALLAR